MAKPPKKTPASDPEGSTSTTTRAPSENTQLPGNRVTIEPADFHWPGTDTTPGTRPTDTSPDTNPSSESAIITTDIPTVGRSSPEFPDDMSIYQPHSANTLIPLADSGLSRTSEGSLYARIEHIGDVLIRINAKGQYEISTASQHVMVLTKIEGRPLWQKKNQSPHPKETDRNEPVPAFRQIVSLDELIIPSKSARILQPPDKDGLRLHSSGRLYVDLSNNTTVMVVRIEGGRYQAKDSKSLDTYGPVLERIEGTSRWQPEESGPGPSKHPRLEPPVETAHTSTHPGPSDPATVWNGRWQPDEGGAIQPFALRHSRHAKKFRLNNSSWTSQNPFYPFTGETGQRAHYKELLDNAPPSLKNPTSAANIKQKIETFTQWGMKIDIHSLAFFKLPGQVVTEVNDINGGLIADLVNRKSNGQAAIQRIIEPMAGSGFYTNYARAVGFKGDIITNDLNPLISWTQKEITQQPDRVKHYIDFIKGDLVTLGKQYGFEFDPVNLSIKLKSKQHSQALINTESVKNFRDAVKSYFNEVVDVVVELRNGEVVVSEPPTGRTSVSAQLQGDEIVISDPPSTADEKAFLAAVFYIVQNNNQRNTGIVEIKKISNGNYSLHFPVSMMFTDGPSVKLLSSGLANTNHINYISHLHASAERPTHFANEDGWMLLDSIRDTPYETKNQRDLIVLSGHFSDTYSTEAAFMKRIEDHVIPLSENGAKVIITNAYSPYKETAFKTLGFHTFKQSREGKGTAIAKANFLLAINRPALQAAQSRGDSGASISLE